MYKIISKPNQELLESLMIKKFRASMSSCLKLCSKMGLDLNQSTKSVMLKMFTMSHDELREINLNTFETVKLEKNQLISAYCKESVRPEISKYVEILSTSDFTQKMIAKGGVIVRSEGDEVGVLSKGILEKMRIKVNSLTSIYDSSDSMIDTDLYSRQFDIVMNLLTDTRAYSLPKYISDARLLFIQSMRELESDYYQKSMFEQLSGSLDILVGVLEKVRDERKKNQDNLRKALREANVIVAQNGYNETEIGTYKRSSEMNITEMQKLSTDLAGVKLRKDNKKNKQAIKNLEKSLEVVQKREKKNLAFINHYDTCQRFYDEYHTFEKKLLRLTLDSYFLSLTNLYVAFFSQERPSRLPYENESTEVIQFMIDSLCSGFNSIEDTDFGQAMIGLNLARVVGERLLDAFVWEGNTVQEADRFLTEKAKVIDEFVTQVRSQTEREDLAKIRVEAVTSFVESGAEEYTLKATAILGKQREKLANIEETRQRMQELEHANEKELLASIEKLRSRYQLAIELKSREKRQRALEKEIRIKNAKTRFIQSQQDYNQLTKEFESYVGSGQLFSGQYKEISDHCDSALKALSAFQNYNFPNYESWETFFRKEKIIATNGVSQERRHLQKLRRCLDDMLRQKEQQQNLTPDQANCFKASVESIPMSDDVKFIFSELYRPKGHSDIVYGDGGTADGLRYEVSSNTMLSPHGHYQKALLFFCKIDSILKRESLTDSEVELLTFLHSELHSSLRIADKANSALS